MKLLLIELKKLFRLSSLSFSLIFLVLFALTWAFAPDDGIFGIYQFYINSAYQVPALTLDTAMPFLLPLLVAIVGASLLGVEYSLSTLPTVLLRPVSRSQWMLSKMLVALIFPFLLLSVLLICSLAIGFPHGYGSFIGGTGFGEGGLVGVGRLSAARAILELVQAYAMAALTLVPISLIALFFTVMFKRTSSGALACITVLLFMRHLVIFPQLDPFLLSSYLDAYLQNSISAVYILSLILYSLLAAILALLIFERQDI